MEHELAPQQSADLKRHPPPPPVHAPLHDRHEESAAGNMAVQRRARDSATPGHRASRDVRNTLRSAGRPLDRATRQHMEPHFGADFGQVRVHADSDAARSARSVNAHAYTVGRDIVFGEGKYQPNSLDGQKLIAHELTHVMQQRNAAAPASDTPLRIDNSGEASAERAAESATSRRERGPAVTGGGITLQRAACDVGSAPGMSCDVDAQGTGHPAGTNLERFGQDQQKLTPAHKTALAAFVAGWAAGGSKDAVEVHGYASCDGAADYNLELSCHRAEAVRAELKGQGVTSVKTFAHGETKEFGLTPEENRRAIVNRIPSSPVPPTPPGPVPKPKPTPSGPVCGPDVTTPVKDVVALTSSDFRGWSRSDRESRCDSLDSLKTGGFAWDIVELHNNSWIFQNYRPTCATQGATPPCGSTVQVGPDCYYAGSPNYVIFGTMCKLCSDHYTAVGDASGTARFTQSKMEYWIDFYKGGSSPSANYGPSRDWAISGYLGWPSGGTPPPGDRNTCHPVCPTPYSGLPFTYHWHSGTR